MSVCFYRVQLKKHVSIITLQRDELLLLCKETKVARA